MSEFASASTRPMLCRAGKAGFARLLDADIAFPSLVFQFDVLNGDGVGVGVEIGQGLVFRDPAAIDLIGDGKLASLVVYLDNQVLAEILQRDLLPQPIAE